MDERDYSTLQSIHYAPQNTYNRPTCAKQTIEHQLYNYPVVQNSTPNIPQESGPPFTHSPLIGTSYHHDQSATQQHQQPPLLPPTSCHIYKSSQNVPMPSSMYNSGSNNTVSDSQHHIDWVDSGGVVKLPEKMIDMIEITSKDLSPASFCSNLDISDLTASCKTLTKDAGGTNILQSTSTNSAPYNANCYWYNKNDYPSCAQEYSDPVRFSAQKNSDCEYYKPPDMNNTAFTGNYYTPKNHQDTTISFQNQGFAYTNEFFNNTDKKQQILAASNDFNYLPYLSSSDPYNMMVPGTIDQHTECSIEEEDDEEDDESDIIVEESDTENEYEDLRTITKCTICNVTQSASHGTQFYTLTIHTPLTMATQKPIVKKLLELLGRIFTTNLQNTLCNQCLGLINTIDHLQFKLESFKEELRLKYQNSCQLNQKSVPTYEKQNNRHDRGARKKRFQCRKCRKIISIKRILERHTVRHKFPGYLCESCGFRAPTRRHFEAHVKRKHSSTPPPTLNSISTPLSKCVEVGEIRPFSCSNCAKMFRTNSNRIEHENFCTGRLPFACLICDKRFPAKNKLTNHVRLKHDKKFVAICSICNTGFVKLSDYKVHKVSHGSDKRYACEECGKCYKTVGNLNFHRRVHEKVLPFVCTLCEKGFMRKEYLEAHVNNHKGVKSFVCGVCERRFVAQKNLDSHMKVHEGGAKPSPSNTEESKAKFECDECDCSYNTNSGLKRHKQRKHS